MLAGAPPSTMGQWCYQTTLKHTINVDLKHKTKPTEIQIATTNGQSTIVRVLAVTGSKSIKTNAKHMYLRIKYLPEHIKWNKCKDFINSQRIN